LKRWDGYLEVNPSVLYFCVETTPKVETHSPNIRRADQRTAVKAESLPVTFQRHRTFWVSHERPDSEVFSDS
jgi:hypothetical protein